MVKICSQWFGSQPNSSRRTWRPNGQPSLLWNNTGTRSNSRYMVFFLPLQSLSLSILVLAASPVFGHHLQELGFIQAEGILAALTGLDGKSSEEPRFRLHAYRFELMHILPKFTSQKDHERKNVSCSEENEQSVRNPTSVNRCVLCSRCGVFAVTSCVYWLKKKYEDEDSPLWPT